MSKKRREEMRRRRQQRQRRIYIGIGVFVVVIIIAGVVLFTLEGQAPIPDRVETAYAGIPQSTTREGYGRLGDPAAPIIVEEYSSFGCEFCKDLHEEQVVDIKDWVEAGHVQVIFKPIVGFGEPNHAERGARAAICAGEQDHFWEMHDIIFDWQGRYAINGGRLSGASETLDIDHDELMDCYNGGDWEDVTNRALAQFQGQGFNSTPQVQVNEQEVSWTALRSTVENILIEQGLISEGG